MLAWVRDTCGMAEVDINSDGKVRTRHYEKKRPVGIFRASLSSLGCTKPIKLERDARCGKTGGIILC